MPIETRQQLRKAGVILLAAVIASLLFVAILVNRNPTIIRPASIAARYSFTIAAPLIFLSLALAFRPRGLWGIVCAMIAVLVLFGMDLTGLWASGQSEPVVIGGLLPWSDAHDYYSDALGWLEGFAFSAKSSMRPLFAALLSALLAFSGKNLQAALALLVAIAAFSGFFFAQKVKETHGYAAAAAALTLVFLYYRRIAGTTLSENLGLSLALLGFALLWAGAGRRQRGFILAGLFLVSLSLNARPGPFFILPPLILWSAWLFRRTDGRRGFPVMLICSSLAVLLAFAANAAVQKATSASDIIPFSNFAYALYGLAAGGMRYTQIFYDHPEVMQLTGNEHYLAVFRLTFELILNHPLSLVQGVLRYFKVFLDPRSWYGIYGYAGYGASLLDALARSALEALWLVGLYASFKKRKEPHSALLLYGMLGVLLSVPFAPPGDAHKLRLYAAAIPIIAALPAAGLLQLAKWIKVEKPLLPPLKTYFPNRVIAVFSLLLVILSVGGPWFSRWASRPNERIAVQCPAGQEGLLIEYRAGSSITIWPDEVFFLDWMPNYHFNRFNKFLHGLSDSEQMANFENIEAPATLMSAVDIATGRPVWALFHPQALPAEPGVVMRICGGQHGYLFAVDRIQTNAEEN